MSLIPIRNFNSFCKENVSRVADAFSDVRYVNATLRSKSMKIRSKNNGFQLKVRCSSTDVKQSRSKNLHFGRCQHDYQLESRQLLATLLGQVVDDINGNGFRDIDEPGIANVPVMISSFDPKSGQVSNTETVMTDALGQYQFQGLQPGLYQVTETMPLNSVQTWPTVEHSGRSYMVEVGQNNQVIGEHLSAPITAPEANWVESLPGGEYTVPVSADFMFQFGDNGIAPSRVSFSGEMTISTMPADTNGVVHTSITSIQLFGTVQSDQHEQGYLGTIRLTLAAESVGTLVTRSDNPALADSDFGLFAKIEIPNSFGTSEVLYNTSPIPLLAREISRLPAIGSAYYYRGTTTPVVFQNSDGVEQGRLFFATVTPQVGLDFGTFYNATVSGHSFIDNNGDGLFDELDTPLAGMPVTLTKLVEESGSTTEEGSGSDHGLGGPPDGKGEFPNAPITTYTDENGYYHFDNLGPGNYVITQATQPPLTITVPDSPLHDYSLLPILSGSDQTLDFASTFAAGSMNQSTAPDPYPVATHEIVPNLRLGATVVANLPGEPYPNDGVKFESAMVPGSDTAIRVNIVAPTSGDSALLQGWVDFNGDGDFNDPDEQVFMDTPVVSGLNELVISVPAGLSLPGSGKIETYARFRISTDAGLTDAGSATNGEVEDYAVTIYDTSLLGSIRGQTWNDIDGDGLHDPTEPALNDWVLTLKNIDTGQIVSSQVSENKEIGFGSGIAFIDGLYAFDNLLPGNYEVVATPPASFGDYAITLPASEEGAVRYRFNLAEGENKGQWPYPTQIASEGWLGSIAPGSETTTTLGQFFMLKSGSGGSGSSGSSGSGESAGGTGGSPTIRIDVIGSTTILRDTYNPSGLFTSQLTDLQLEGVAVDVNEETGETSVLGHVHVTLGILPSYGTIGTSAGETEATGDVASFALYLRIDASAFGMGTIINTHPIVASGSVSQLPLIGTALAREGKGSPIAMIDESTGQQVARMISAALLPMFGVDSGAFALGDLTGSVFEDTNNDGVQDENEGGLAGVTVRVEQDVAEEEGGSSSHGSGSSSHGNGGGGETEVPPVYLTRTDSEGNWSITGLGSGPWKVTVIAPPSYAITGGETTQHVVTLTSGLTSSGLNFMVYPLNDAPTMGAPATVSTDEDLALVFSSASGNAIVVADPDAGNDPVEATLESTLGTMSLSVSNGLTFLSGSPTNSTRMVFTGTLDAINAALEGMSFHPTANQFGTGGISILIDDQGHNGAGGPLTVSQSVAIEIAAVADAPGLVVSNANGLEGQLTPLAISLTSNDPTGTEVMSLIISGVPSNALLSAGTKMPDGTYALTPDQLSGLKMLAQDNGSFMLTVLATSTAPTSGSIATVSKQMTVSVANVAPSLISGGGQATIPGVVKNFNLGQMNDVAGDGPWQVGVDWGDGAHSDLVVLDPVGFQLSADHGYGSTGLKNVQVTVTDKDGDSATSSFQVVSGPPAIEKIEINDGSAQRSMVQTINLYFNGIVSMGAGTINLVRQNGRTVPNTSIVVDSFINDSQKTVATVRFTGRGATGGSIMDGRFRLNINMDLIHDVATGLVATNGFDSAPGGNRSFDFFRLFGDSNGNAVIDSEDRSLYRSALRSQEGDANYVAYFDYNSNGLISSGDLDQFRRRRRV